MQKLQTLPPDAVVVTEDYESGYEPIKQVELIKVEEQNSEHWWDGKYEKTDKGDGIEVVFWKGILNVIVFGKGVNSPMILEKGMSIFTFIKMEAELN